MKPKNFPARKLQRQMTAQGFGKPDEDLAKLNRARSIRTKKNRSNSREI